MRKPGWGARSVQPTGITGGVQFPLLAFMPKMSFPHIERFLVNFATLKSRHCRAQRVPHTGRLLLLALSLGCGDSEAPGDATQDGGPGGTRGGEIAAVVIDSAPLVGTRIGQRWPLTATALDAFDEPIPEVAFDWDSSDVSTALVDSEGLVTAMAAGDAQITVTVAGHSDSVQLTARSAVPSDVGEMYTTWFARSDDAPVAIVDGRLEVFTIYPGAGPATRPWPHPGVERFQWAGDRLAILTDVVDGLGTLRVRDRHEEWTILRVGDAMGFQLAGTRIAEHGAGGSLRVKEDLHGPWTTLAPSGVEQYQLDGDRIALLEDNGSFRVQESIGGEWTELATTGVREFELHGDRIAVLLDENDGELRVTDDIDGPWTTLEVRVSKVVLDGNRIGVLRKDGVASIRDGIDGEWTVLERSYVQDMQLDGDRIAIQFEVGDLRATDDLDEPWVVLATAPTRFLLQGDYIGILREGELWFKVGLHDDWSEVTPAGTVTQFLPVADVPVPPARTTPADYTGPRHPCAGIVGDSWQCPIGYPDAQQRCIQDGARCEPVSEPSSQVPDYGRFCGADRPAGPDWNWAHGPDGGPMDSFDALCMHQAHAASWYPETEDGLLDACIVRYGLTFSRLTRDGTVISPGTAAYDEIMNEMKNLRDATADDEWYNANCSSDQLEEFIAATRAKH